VNLTAVALSNSAGVLPVITPTQLTPVPLPSSITQLVLGLGMLGGLALLARPKTTG
jgi:hypothetical protein